MGISSARFDRAPRYGNKLKYGIEVWGGWNLVREMPIQYANHLWKDILYDATVPGNFLLLNTKYDTCY